jgi:hypothetical protein
MMTLPGQTPWPTAWGDDTCGEHQPRAAAPAPEAGTGALQVSAELLEALSVLLDCCDQLLGAGGAPTEEADKMRRAAEMVDTAFFATPDAVAPGAGVAALTAERDRAMHACAVLAQRLGALSATPPRPALDPETRRVLEDALHGISRARGMLTGTERMSVLLDKHAEDIRAHIAAHGGGND